MLAVATSMFSKHHFNALAIACTCSGPVPQQPPMIFTPAECIFFAAEAKSSGDTR
jgi:hypothetical protein